jgi:hypothetical protein
MTKVWSDKAQAITDADSSHETPSIADQPFHVLNIDPMTDPIINQVMLYDVHQAEQILFWSTWEIRKLNLKNL